MASHGGVEVMHGYTHPWDATINSYTGVTADDNELYRVIENPDDSLNHVGALAVQYLKDTIAGLKALGYTFVSPGSL